MVRNLRIPLPQYGPLRLLFLSGPSYTVSQSLLQVYMFEPGSTSKVSFFKLKAILLSGSVVIFHTQRKLFGY